MPSSIVGREERTRRLACSGTSRRSLWRNDYSAYRRAGAKGALFDVGLQARAILVVGIFFGVEVLQYPGPVFCFYFIFFNFFFFWGGGRGAG